MKVNECAGESVGEIVQKMTGNLGGLTDAEKKERTALLYLQTSVATIFIEVLQTICVHSSLSPL